MIQRFSCVVALAAGVGGCTCSKPPDANGAPSPSSVSAGSGAAQASSSPSSSARPAGPRTEGAWVPLPGSDVFSAPIAGLKAGDRLLAAGLVVSAQAIRLVGLSTSGATEWTADVLTSVKWKNGARLRLFPAGDGAAVVWTGEREGATGTFVAIVGPRGQAKGAPFAIGPAAATRRCTTDEVRVEA